ncbi:glutaminyl-peptide cyclotransferase isoform X2 [Cajanus cajan]|uniref:glutaminyl-peptide cyclotransferase isoform X2 n=1 Tax=Cajanus cajan TaxID=3821 RepID=UPI00098DA85F|nr:glutaminyl-peptide cyclotransferase isoform X2 [Cajanus cajan]
MHYSHITFQLMKVTLMFHHLSLSLSLSISLSALPIPMATFALPSASLIVSLVALLLLSSNELHAFQRNVSFETVTVVNVFPHDPQAFTEGLLYHGNDTLFESTGLYGEVENIQKMDNFLFGEGLTLLNNRLFQVTWLHKDGFIYDPNNLSEIGTFNHDMKDGWGLATDGKVLFGSDGSSTLYQIDPQTFKAISNQVVYYKGHQVYNLNELEYINGEIWANVLPTDCIVRISPNDGSVLGWILLQNLREELMEAGMISDNNVLNGIAWDGEQKRIFVTGKLWPKLYEIKVSPIKKPIEEGIIEQLCLHGLTQPKEKVVNLGRKLRA